MFKCFYFNTELPNTSLTECNSDTIQKFGHFGVNITIELKNMKAKSDNNATVVI